MALVEVTKAEFYDKIGPMNVHPRSERDVTYWETPNRALVGKSTPGYANAMVPKTYFLER
jgi:hypothetical protein